MKFKVLMNSRQCMHHGHSMTIVGDDKISPFSINEFLNEVIKLMHMEKEKKGTTKKKKQEILNKMINLKIGEAMPIYDENHRIIVGIERVEESVSIGDLIDYII